MLNFIKWLELKEQSTLGTEEVDARQIETFYKKAGLSVKLAQEFDVSQNMFLLKNISTVTTLSGGAMGMFISQENQNIIPQDIIAKLKIIFPNDPNYLDRYKKLPREKIFELIGQYISDADKKRILESTVIHVNIQKHIQAYGDSPAAIIETASTILHEAKHVQEFNDLGKTSEVGPIVTEKTFKNWVKANWNRLSKQFNFAGDYPFRN